MDRGEKRKREDKSFEKEETKIRKLETTKANNKNLFFMEVPDELLNIIIEDISRKDLINLSCINHEHRGLFYLNIFKNIQLKWKDIKGFLENFKQLDKVERIHIICDCENRTETNNGEWNVSFKKLFELCRHLKDMHIELLTSGRCLKYKDDFDVELSDNIEKMTLVSQSVSNNGDVNDKAMFELTQLQRFHKIRELTLRGFSIAKDIYFYPKIKEDMSDFKKRCIDGKLIELDDIKLINCAWEYPVNLKEVFSPEYPIPGGNNNMMFMNNIKNCKGYDNCKPSKIGLYYSGDYIKFTGCERFKNFINTEYNDKFLFEVDFYKELKELEIVIMNDRQKENVFTCYYPWIDMINLRREYYTQDKSDGEIIKQSIFSNLEKLVLVGWRSSSIQELDKVFKINEGIEMKMKHFELYLMRSGNHQRSGDVVTPEERMKIEKYRTRLEAIFGEGCCVKVGFVEECMDGRYDDVFGEAFRV